LPDLTGLPALDLAIGLSFIYLVLSLLCSTVQETIASLLALRATTLETGLRNMLSGEHTDSDTDAGKLAGKFFEDLYEQPLIRSLHKPSRPWMRWWRFGLRGGKRLPSYISPRVFSLAMLDTLAPPPGDGSRHDVVAALWDKLKAASLPSDLERTLLSLLRDADHDINKFRKRLEEWFDDTMARVSGWYKRKTQIILAVLAVIVTVALNANSLTIGERLWKDPAVRASVVAQANKATQRTHGKTPQARLQNAAENVDEVQKLGVPMGWTKGDDVKGFWKTAGGWLLTAIALSLGAPFWFDTLSRLSRLRSSGKPEAPLPASASGSPRERVGGPGG
jgi:hypothetical protein